MQPLLMAAKELLRNKAEASSRDWYGKVHRDREADDRPVSMMSSIT